LHLSPDNDLWVATASNGLNRYNAELQNFDRYHPGAPDEFNISSNKINAVCSDKNGNIWIASEDTGVDCIIPGFGLLRNYQVTEDTLNSICSNNIKTILCDSRINIFRWFYEYFQAHYINLKPLFC
jgi:sugar lactone lactonase YvrE